MTKFIYVQFIILLGCVSFSFAETKEKAEDARPIIRTIEFSGNKALTTDALLKRITLHPGKRLVNDQLKFSIGVIESTYRDQGYYIAKASSQIHSVSSGTVDIAFTITEGDLYSFGDITIKGNKRITNKIIMRELGVKKGDHFSQSKVFDGNRKLYMTGYFDTIEIHYSTMTTRVIDMTLIVKERATKFVKGGFGYGTESKERVTLGYEDNNFLGNERRLDVSATHSGFITSPSKYRTTIVQTTLTQPYFLNTPLEAQANVSREWDDRESYDSAATAFRASLGRHFGKRITSSLRYRYQATRLSNVAPDAVIPAFSNSGTIGPAFVASNAASPGFSNISAIGPTFTYDNTDDPFLPHNGWRIIGTAEEGMRLFFGDVRFHKLESRAGRFDTIFNGWTFFEGLQAGEIRPHSTSDRDIIPIYERYFIGGANTVRGYNERELGPRDSFGVPTGGNAFIVGNLELRHQIYKKLYGVTFVDGGQLYATPPGEVSPDIHARSIGDFLYGTGFGFRLHSPVGAIRLEFGYKLNPIGDKEFLNRTAIHFSLGEVF